MLYEVITHTNQFAEIIPDKQENVLPQIYYELTGKDPQTLYALLIVITSYSIHYTKLYEPILPLSFCMQLGWLMFILIKISCLTWVH